MCGRKRLEVPAELAAARDRLRSWRQRRNPGTRVRKRLWVLAVRLAAAGLYAVSLVTPMIIKELSRPHILVDQLIEAGTPLPEEVESVGHKNVCAGPYLAGAEEQPPAFSGPHEVPPDGVVVAAYRPVYGFSSCEDTLQMVRRSC